MVAFKCPHCGSRLEPDPAAPTAPVRCACGKLLRPPAPKAAAKSETPASGDSADPLAALAQDADWAPAQRRTAPSAGTGQPDGLAPPPAAEPMTYAQVFARKRKKSQIPMMVIAIVLVPLIIGGVVLTWWLANSTYYEELDPQGRVIFRGRISLEEAARRREEVKKRNLEQVTQHSTGAGVSFFDDKPRPTGNTPSSGGTQDTTAALPPMPKGDDKINLYTWNRIDDVTGADGSGWLVGSIQNTSDSPAKIVQLAIEIQDESGKPQCRLSATVEQVPAHGAGKFSVRYGGVKADDFKHVKVQAVPQYYPAGAVIWDIDPTAAHEDDSDPKTLVLDGVIRNNKQFDVGNAWIYALFLDRSGRVVASTRGDLAPESNGRVRAGRGARFTVKFDISRIPRQMIHNYDLRLVAQRD